MLLYIQYEEGIVKPDPKIFQIALQRLNIRPEHAIMIGDSLISDIKPALSLGMKAILFDPDNLNKTYADRITSLNKLKQLL